MEPVNNVDFTVRIAQIELDASHVNLHHTYSTILATNAVKGANNAATTQNA